MTGCWWTRSTAPWVTKYAVDSLAESVTRQKLAYYEVEEMTKRGVPGVWTWGFYDGWAANYMFYAANGHNAIGRFYETFGGRGADTGERRPETPEWMGGADPAGRRRVPRRHAGAERDYVSRRIDGGWATH